MRSRVVHHSLTMASSFVLEDHPPSCCNVGLALTNVRLVVLMLHNAWGLLAAFDLSGGRQVGAKRILPLPEDPQGCGPLFLKFDDHLGISVLSGVCRLHRLDRDILNPYFLQSDL